MNHDRAPRSSHRISRRSPGFLASIVIALCIALLTAACAGSARGGGSTQATKDSLTIAFGQEPSDWNYLRNPETAIRSLLMLNVLEPLLDKKKDGTLVPLLAESYTMSGDGTVYTFKIRKAVFSDGSALTADDVVYSLEQSRTTKLQDVAARLKAVKQVSKVDSRTVKVTLSTPSQRFLEAMSTDSGLVIPRGSANSLNKAPVGSGPFAFRDWKNGVEVDLVRNDRYWGTKPALRTITWRFIKDPSAAVNALRAGDVDMIGAFGGNKAQIDSITRTPGFTKSVVSGREMVYLSLNATDPAFADPRVRQAVAYSLDRQAFINGTTGSGEPACTFVNPPNEPWRSDKCPYPHDPAKAKQLLTEAGKQGLTLHYTYLAGTEAGVAIISQGLQRAGFKVQAQALEFPAYLDRVLTKAQYQITHISGPQQIDAWTCPGFFTKDCYPEMDSLLARADRALDRTEWANLRREAVEKDAERAYLIPAWTTDVTSLYRTGLQGSKPFASNSEIDLRGLRWGAG
ncbi:ABC transporter substrate-binding protein [Kribbella sp.]|uniref:ABC transporter substrate-binding protein n=1 Tax=Kribbella sp. TaxID=1871183 RepID=UPI002D373272|nr:ABC transporter substrate-binding protein [Kribbella sp.]HZX08256.1 ABC transporter substrate-binding protein [Kribbella sp.]